MDFLCTVVPTGYTENILFTLVNGYPIQRHCKFASSDYPTVLSQLQSRGGDMYFALGGYKKNADNLFDRKAENCTHLKSLWLDIDAGAKKYSKHGDEVYKTQEDALVAIVQFLDDTGFQAPTYIVSSGEGYHVYWAFAETIPKNEWSTLAKGLRQACVEHGLRADHSRTTDAASVLRIPDTQHKSSGKLVTIELEGELVDKDTFVAALSRYSPTKLIKEEFFDLNQPIPSYLDGDSVSGISVVPAHKPRSFEKIIMLQRDERSGCPQLYDLYKHQDKVPEPLWRAGLSIAQYCDDRDKWIHELSNKYEGYSPSETEQKATACKGPYTCDTFAQLNPKGCEGCPHRARGMKSPIVLGLDPDNKPVRVVSKDVFSGAERVHVVPSYPKPFFRPPQGGIWARVKNQMTMLDEDVCVWAYDLYITERVAAVDTQQYWCVHHSPMDGIKEFTLHSDDVATGGEGLLKTLYGNGIPVAENRRKLMSRYIQQSVKQRVETAQARDSHPSMGWTEDDTFIAGDREYTSSGVRNAPISSTKLAAHFSKAMRIEFPPEYKNDPLAGWRELLSDAYPNGYKSALAGQYIVCAGLGAPIAAKFALEDQRSGLINIFSDGENGTGRGKTTATALATRIYGQPDAFTVKNRDGATMNAFYEMLGYASSIPLVRDEITLLEPAEISSLAYSLVNGKTKMRMEGQNNDLREGEKRWSTYVFSTSNKSIVDSLIAERGDPTAQYSRVTEFEYPMPEWLDLEPDRGFARNARVARNKEEWCGVAGAPLLAWIVNNHDMAKELYFDTYDALASKIKAPRSKARFWLNHATGVVVGALVGEMLGLHPFNVDAIMQYAIDVLDNMHARSSTTAISSADAVSDMLNAYMDRWLVFNKDGLATTEVRKDVAVRVEDSTGTMYILADAVKQYAKTKDRTAASMENFIQRIGGVKKRVRMLRGTQYSSTGALWAWEIELDTPAAIAWMSGELS